LVLLSDFNRAVTLAKLFKSSPQVFRYHVSRAAFDVMALNHVHQFTIFKQRYAR
jgi:hypothetical protein